MYGIYNVSGSLPLLGVRVNFTVKIWEVATMNGIQSTTFMDKTVQIIPIGSTVDLGNRHDGSPLFAENDCEWLNPRGVRKRSSMKMKDCGLTACIYYTADATLKFFLQLPPS